METKYDVFYSMTCCFNHNCFGPPTRLASFLMVVALLCAGSSTWAQGAQAASNLYLTTLAWGNSAGPYYYLNGGKVEELRAYSRGISRPVRYQGPRTIGLYLSEAAPALPVEERPPPDAVVTIPVELHRALLLFIKQGDGSTRVRVFDANVQNFPAGSYRFVNLSDKTVVLALGDEPELTTLLPKAVTLVRKPPLSGSRLNVNVQMAQSGPEGNPQLIYRSLWGYRENRRVMVFVVPGENPNVPVKVLYFDETAPKDTAVDTENSTP